MAKNCALKQVMLWIRDKTQPRAFNDEAKPNYRK